MIEERTSGRGASAAFLKTTNRIQTVLATKLRSAADCTEARPISGDASFIFGAT
jgi:hypothetical protein